MVGLPKGGRRQHRHHGGTPRAGSKKNIPVPKPKSMKKKRREQRYREKGGK